MKKINIVLLITLLMFPIVAFSNEGQIGISSDIEEAFIYVNEKKMAMIGDGYTTIILKEGDYDIRVFKHTKEYDHEGNKHVYIGENTSVKIHIRTEKRPTKERQRRIDDENRIKYNWFQKNNIEGVYADFSTKLIWQDNKAVRYSLKSWNDGNSYCSNLTLGNVAGWRLPTKKELTDIRTKDIEFANFYSENGENTSNYWTATFEDGDRARKLSKELGIEKFYWFVPWCCPMNEYQYADLNEDKIAIRCVRDGS